MKGIVVEIATLINAPPHHVPRQTHYGQVLVEVALLVLVLVLVLVSY